MRLWKGGSMSVKDTTKDTLDMLFRGLGEELLRRIQKREASASDLAVARQFLKDNGISGDPTANNTLSTLHRGILDINEDDLPDQTHLN